MTISHYSTCDSPYFCCLRDSRLLSRQVFPTTSIAFSAAPVSQFVWRRSRCNHKWQTTTTLYRELRPQIHVTLTAFLNPDRMRPTNEFGLPKCTGLEPEKYYSVMTPLPTLTTINPFGEGTHRQYYLQPEGLSTTVVTFHCQENTTHHSTDR